VRLNLPSLQELPVPESLPSPSLSVSINANNRHLISHSYLTISIWKMPVCTSQSLPPLRPCLSPGLAINSTTSNAGAAIPQTSLPTSKCQPQPLRQYALLHESLAHPPPCCPLACLTQNCPALGILPPRHHFGFAIHSALPTSARKTSTELYLVRLAVHKRDPS
jgi:hypothetical protein